MQRIDGVELDGSSRAALSFGVKALFAEQYLRDLADKTRRGLWGNAREGKATGGKTFGYRTGANGVIEIVETEAEIVRLIFRLYADGYGYARIAAELNAKGIPPPRGGQLRRAADRSGKVPNGWISSCIRELLRNPKYVGAWAFGVREWLRHPDTRRRVARDRSEANVLRVDRPKLAIVNRDRWDLVQARLVAQAKSYNRHSAATTHVPRKRTTYFIVGSAPLRRLWRDARDLRLAALLPLRREPEARLDSVRQRIGGPRVHCAREDPRRDS